MKFMALALGVGAFLGFYGAGCWWMRKISLPPGPSRLHWGGIVFGHRGCRFIPGVPENTLPAFSNAVLQGCRGIECDVRLTKDGHAVVFHDLLVGQHLEGVPLGRRIDDLTLAELKHCTFADDSTKQIRIPTLVETVEFARSKELYLFIEVKEARRLHLFIDNLAELFQQYGDYLYERATVISFYPQALYSLRTRDTRIAVGQLYSPDLFRSWDSHKNGPLPFIVKALPGLWDAISVYIICGLSPRLSGCSFICPKYVMYNSKLHSRWVKDADHPTAIYLWGFPNSAACSPEMRTTGVCVSGDDHHSEFFFPSFEQLAI